MSGIYAVFVIVFLVVTVIKNAEKKKKQSGASQQKPVSAPQKKQEVPQVSGNVHAPIQPSVTFPDRKRESVSAGSLAFRSSEGIDPCHDEMLTELNEAESMDGVPESRESPFRLSFGANELVNGFVMSEILNRKTVR